MSVGMKHNAPRTDPTGQVPDSFVWRTSGNRGNQVANSSPLGGLLTSAGGGDITETIHKYVPDYNRRDKGLFEDPPVSD